MMVKASIFLLQNIAVEEGPSVQPGVVLIMKECIYQTLVPLPPPDSDKLPHCVTALEIL